MHSAPFYLLFSQFRNISSKVSFQSSLILKSFSLSLLLTQIYKSETYIWWVTLNKPSNVNGLGKGKIKILKMLNHM